MSEQFKVVYITAVCLLFLTTPLRDVITQECTAFSFNISPLYITFLSLFWLLWMGYTFGTIILSFSKMHSNPRLPSNKSECRDVRVKCHSWTELELNSAVDTSLLGLIEEILSHHVLNWYAKISSQPAFTSEVQSLLHYLARALILRWRHCDVTRLLKLKLIPCVLQHIHTSKLTPSSDRAQHPTLGHAARLPAYASLAVQILLEHVTPIHTHCSPLMTSLLSQTVGNRVIAGGILRVSNPIFIYRLFHKLLDPNIPPIDPKYPSSPIGPLLAPLFPPSPLGCITLENEELALFVRYLQGQDELGVLRCLLDLTEVNEQLDGPKIHKQSSVGKIRCIRETFFLSPTKYSLPLSPASLHTLQIILDTSSDTNDVIAKLQETRVVSQLLDQLISARDKYLYPCFLRSGTFRSHALSRRLKPSQVTKLSEERKQGRGLSLRKKISPLTAKKLVKSATIDVPPNPPDSVDRDVYRRTISDEASQESRQRVTRTRSGGLENVVVSEDQLEFDLSLWELTVPEVTRNRTLKSFHQFVLHVMRRDVTPHQEWSTFRRYSEFEVLDSMLRKFFPSAKIGQLPRKILFISSQELETRRKELEVYLRSLLRMSELQQSELVCKFLCEFNDDKIFQAENFGDHAGRMLLALPKSILTDKYEFLNKPLDSFLESTLEPPYRHSGEVSNRVSSSREKWCEDSREYSKVFEGPPDPPSPHLVPPTPLTLHSWGEILQFLFNSVLSVPHPIKLLTAVMNLFLPYHSEVFLEKSADRLIDQLSNESYVIFLINKIRDTLYHSTPQVYNRDLLKSELMAQRQSLEERIINQIPEIAIRAIGKDQLLGNLEVVLECFMSQERNQQLVSSLLDQIILELFPELT